MVSTHSFIISTTATLKETIIVIFTLATETATAAETATIMVISTVSAAATVKGMNTVRMVEIIAKEGK